MRSEIYSWIAILTLSLLVSGCSSIFRRSEHAPETAPSAESEVDEVTALREQKAILENDLKVMRERVGFLESRLETLEARKTGPGAGQIVNAKASDRAGVPVVAEVPASPSEGGMRIGAPEILFRQAWTDLTTGRRDQALSGFDHFAESYPDHILASAAHYTRGSILFDRKEFAAAQTAFERVITSYPLSSHISSALRMAARTSDVQNDSQAAIKYRQQLYSLFPQSPAAALAEVDEDSLGQGLPIKKEKAESQPLVSPQRLDAPPTFGEDVTSPEGT